MYHLYNRSLIFASCTMDGTDAEYLYLFVLALMSAQARVAECHELLQLELQVEDHGKHRRRFRFSHSQASPGFALVYYYG